MVAQEFEPKDFKDYQRKLIDHPLERTIEAYRRKQVLESIFAQSGDGFANALEVGIGLKGVLSEVLIRKTATVVEPISDFVIQDRLRKYSCPVVYVESTLEDYLADENSQEENYFDLIVLSSVLHELQDPEYALKGLRRLLAAGGVIVVVVPNKYSIHRLLGLALGMTKSLGEKTSTELRMGQRGAYSLDTLEQELSKAGFTTTQARTFFPKFLSSAQIQSSLDAAKLSEDFLDLSFQHSEAFEPYGSEILMVATKAQEFE